jgi:hypothetical protein
MNEPYLSRYWSRLDVSAGSDACWPWTMALDSGGYGIANIGPNTRERVHRIAVRLDGRDIPQGWSVDHLCRNRACGNPRHLEVVTIGENVRRNFPFRTLKTHCPKGHPTLRPQDRTIRGACRTCKNIQGLARYHRLVAARPRQTVCKYGHQLGAMQGTQRCHSCRHLKHVA